VRSLAVEFQAVEDFLLDFWSFRPYRRDLVGQLIICAVLFDCLIGGNHANLVGDLLLWLWIDLNRWVDDFLDLLNSLGVVVEIVNNLTTVDAEKLLYFVGKELKELKSSEIIENSL
jgi:hypothetical protein